MWKNRRCGCCGRGRRVGVIFISIGVGVLLAHLMPYYLLIFLFGSALIFLGIRSILKK